jgi:hypothetical protein
MEGREGGEAQGVADPKNNKKIPTYVVVYATVTRTRKIQSRWKFSLAVDTIKY